MMPFLYTSTQRKMSIDDDDSRSSQRGNSVDSISYYRNQLTELNETVSFMQRQKRTIVEEGNDRINATEWISNVFHLTSDTNSSAKNRNGLLVGFQQRRKTKGLFQQIAFDFFFSGFAFLNRNLGKHPYCYLYFILRLSTFSII